MRSTKKYFEENNGVMTHMNLIEIHHALLKQFSEKDADDTAKTFSRCAVVPSLDVIIAVSKFRLQHKNVSFVDAVGYVYAKANGMKFLTGDKEFKSLLNVEFVKA